MEGLLTAYLAMENSLGHFYTYWGYLEMVMPEEQLDELILNSSILEYLFEDFDRAVYAYLSGIPSDENVSGVIHGDYHVEKVFRNGEVLFRRNNAD